MEQNITEVSGMVGNLRNMAIDMNTEINTQNRQVGRIQIKVKYTFNYFFSSDGICHKQIASLLKKKVKIIIINL